MSAAKLNIDELEAGYPLFCKALRLLILKGNSVKDIDCLLYTSPSPRDKRQSRMPSSA